MSPDSEIDVEALRTELEQIKDAMGIGERYAGATTLWLLLGVLVAVASALSQYVHLERLPPASHWVIWLVVFGGGFLAWFARREPPEVDWSREGKPNLFVQFGLVYLASIPVQSVAGAYAGDLGYAAESTLALSVIVVFLGVAYGVFGSSMAAYYVRLRDRAVFYVGTVWMVALGTAMPQVDALETWGYAAFGGLYLAYALGAYGYFRLATPTAGGERP